MNYTFTDVDVNSANLFVSCAL